MSSPEPLHQPSNVKRLPGVNIWIEDTSAVCGQRQGEGRVERLAGLNVRIDEASNKATPPDNGPTAPKE